MADAAATLEATHAATDSRRAAIRAAGTGFSLGRMLAMTRKELRSYFAFPLVYVLAGVFAVLAGYYAYTDLVFFVTIAFSRDIIQNYWQLLFSDLRLCMLLTLPFITMRQFAEERKLGTVELLYTYPLRDGEILGGKFLASVAIFLMMLLLTTLYPIYLYTVHWFPLFPLFAGYTGLLLIGCAFIACGIFISSLCESQVMAGMGTITLLLFFWILNWNEAIFQGSWLAIVRSFSLFDQFGGFAKGVIDLDHIAYFIFFIMFFLFLTLRSMEARKWTGRR
ncbi:MAG: ABC-type transport system involved in multi-copper enzyme maturation, permease component [Candidatus Binatus sp.]|jgi:ABC-2 type transport system permease protein|nr:ABC-type transport system involved in multi-copper enzyme maturation, permease component [Candidatus Binatus sp.]